MKAYIHKLQFLSYLVLLLSGIVLQKGFGVWGDNICMWMKNNYELTNIHDDQSKPIT